MAPPPSTGGGGTNPPPPADGGGTPPPPPPPPPFTGTLRTIDPVTRLEGHMSVKIDTSGGKVTSAWCSGELWRGFESILVGRDPRDAPIITQRVCGVCHSVHRLTSILALENAVGLTPPPDAVRIRNILEGANFVYSHLAHLFILAGPDYDLYGLVPGLSAGANLDAYNNILKTAVLPAQRLCHEISAVFGGKTPHHMTTVPGGATNVPNQNAIDSALAKIAQIKSIAAANLPPVLDYLEANKPELQSIGRGYGNFISYGVFPDADAPNDASRLLLKRGIWVDGALAPLDIGKITEYVKYSWYTDASGGKPAAETAPQDQYGKANAYTWLKSPRYDGYALEAGPLARMAVSGLHPRQASIYDRLMARASEAVLVLTNLEKWIGELVPGGQVYVPYANPTTATGIGLWEAPRGANAHWVSISGGRISGYQLLPPTNWNASPRDDAGLAGPIEQALVGAPVADVQKPVNALKVVRSFDPCLACAVH